MSKPGKPPPKDNQCLERENQELLKRVEELEEELTRLRDRLRRAKDPRPVDRISFRRLRQLAESTCLRVTRVGRKIQVSLGETAKRLFKSLKEAWEFLSQDDWSLGELFPPPPPPKTKSKPRNKPCKNCGQLIYWKWDGKPTPFNADNHERHYCQEHYQRRRSFHDRIKTGGEALTPF